MHSPFRRSASPSFVAGAMCALGAGAASVPLASGFPWAQALIGTHPSAVLVIALLTAALTYAVVAATLQKSVPMIVVYGTLGGSAVSVVSMLALFGVIVAGETNVSASTDLGFLFVFVVVAGGVGAMIGFVFSLFLIAPVAIAARQIDRRTVDGGAYTGIACAIWLVGVAGAALPFTPSVDTWAIGPLTSITGLIVAVIVFARSASRLREVRRFIASVRRGEQRGYRVRPLEAGEDLLALNDACLFSSTPASWANVEVLEETALDVQAYRGFSPMFRPAALVRAAA